MINIENHNKILRGYKFIDLFAGIGGFHYALKSYGAECVFASEIDKKASETYYINHQLRPKGDITEVNEQDIPTHEILCGGFPCQAFSISGKQKGFEDTRGTLFFDIARIIDYQKPKILFLENVKNFVKHDKGRTLETVLKTLKNLNYTVFHKVLNTSNFGLPQNRERVYIVGFNNNDFKEINFSFPNPNLISSLENILEINPEKGKIIERNDISIYKDFHISSNMFGEIDLPNKPIQIGKVNKGGQGERIYHSKGHAITLSAYGGGVGSKTGLYKVGDKIRKLSPRECARVQGFPDSFILPESITEAHKQFGNSVSINTLQFIIDEISKAIQNNDRQSRIRLSNSQEWIQERERHSSKIQQLAK
jgi:DNA (cytosine-5)-methyltransferase 1